jgi:hypothetical protein
VKDVPAASYLSLLPPNQCAVMVYYGCLRSRGHALLLHRISELKGKARAL